MQIALIQPPDLFFRSKHRSAQGYTPLLSLQTGSSNPAICSTFSSPSADGCADSEHITLWHQSPLCNTECHFNHPSLRTRIEAKQASAFLPSSITQQQSFGSVSTDNNNNIKKEIVGCRREKASSAVAAATSPSPGEARNHGPPAGGESAPTAGTARAPSYRRLYDAAMQLLQSELQLEPYPIPAGLEGNSAVVGKGRNQQVPLFLVATSVCLLAAWAFDLSHLKTKVIQGRWALTSNTVLLLFGIRSFTASDCVSPLPDREKTLLVPI